ncbi:biotin--[acetyl-CoA-carboxylase] ligase [candidate division TA06 bacterium]|uniref:Bifunctional ligase/repressor BirA n=1 Tax=candidate division TA06 bacterium TaxID=2250710 RepID=A0A523XN93_UNCT6|nr:MAG: biotin--[acetyl-CoA-carboxylase] ligase [candidate division TA06 bacterium]
MQQEDGFLEDIEEKIAQFLKVGEYVRSDELVAEAGCSLDELENFLSSLKKRGYEIEENPALGIRLLEEPDTLSEVEIARRLKTSVIGRKAYCYSSVGSTNELAIRLGQQGTEEGAVIIANEQTKGKGRFGRSWVSPRREGIWMSLILRPEPHLEPATALSLVAAYSVAIALREVAGVRAMIKWPTDVRVGEKKICGILAELSKDARGNQFIVLGFGVNVNQSSFSGDLEQVATSVKIETGEKIPRLPLIRKLLENLEEFYFQCKKDGFSGILKGVREISTLMGRRVEVSLGGETISGYVQDIDDMGRLIIRTDDGNIREIFAGEANTVR